MFLKSVSLRKSVVVNLCAFKSSPVRIFTAQTLRVHLHNVSFCRALYRTYAKNAPFLFPSVVKVGNQRQHLAGNPKVANIMSGLSRAISARIRSGIRCAMTRLPDHPLRGQCRLLAPSCIKESNDAKLRTSSGTEWMSCGAHCSSESKKSQQGHRHDSNLQKGNLIQSACPIACPHEQKFVKPTNWKPYSDLLCYLKRIFIYI
ncbi:uncharacterized protein LOC129745622 isoform X2 [Uranotaenia lowii]|uniref:uncharacterized protein LOC129745622 isoform X2 n=1 Tax=Uranotaenia lowii TaxID=190385 RepID=UPI00247A962F|nr:uncharacterized protein LOC129745622 isoform X2 [Uranotaenia lowii]